MSEENQSTRSEEPDLARAPVLCLTAPPWRNDRVLKDLFASLGERNARIVGGAVRNALMGRDVTDIDIATRLHPEEVMRRAEQAGFSPHPVGIDHGSVLLARDGRTFEVTTLRRDVRTDGRHAIVAFTDDWREDACRRDFTMNALYADLAGNVYDPLCSGVRDALAGHVRFIGDANARIREDYLRILRFFRFWAEYDTGAPDKDALAAIRQQKEGLRRISRERIREEMRRLLLAPRAAEALDYMTATGIAACILPKACTPETTVLARMLAIDARLHLQPDWLLRLCAICGPHAALKDLFRLSRQEASRMHKMHQALAPVCQLIEQGKAADIRRWQVLASDLGTQTILDALRLCHARGALTDADLARLIPALETFTPPPFPLSGRDVLALGIAPGPQVGQLLRRVRTRWQEQGFQPATVEGLKDLLREEAIRQHLIAPGKGAGKSPAHKNMASDSNTTDP